MLDLTQTLKTPPANEDELKDLMSQLTPDQIAALSMMIDEVTTTAAVIMAREDPNSFVTYCMRAEGGRTMQQSWFHRQWQILMNALKGSPENPYGRVLIEAFRGAGKTQQISAMCGFQLGHYSNIRIKIISGLGDHARKGLNYVKNLVEHNERYHEVFPHVVPGAPWGAGSMSIAGHRERDANVEAWSIFGQGAGNRSDLLIPDDVVNEQNAIVRPAMQEQVKRTFFQTWMNTFSHDKGIPYGQRVVYAATPWTTTDLTANLKTLKAWRTAYCRVPIVNDEGQSNWPEHLTLEDIQQKKDEQLDPFLWTCQMMLNPIDDTLRIFNSDIIQQGQATGMKAAGCAAPWGSEEYMNYVTQGPMITSVDLAVSLDARTSSTVIFTQSHVDDILWPVDIRVLKTVNADEIVAEILSVHRSFNPEQIVVESIAFQTWMLQLLEKENSMLPIVPVKDTVKKIEPDIGIYAMAGYMSRGKYAIPVLSPIDHEMGCDCEFCTKHRPGCKCGVCTWIRELTQYGVGGNDDTVLAMWFGWHKFSRFMDHRSVPRVHPLTSSDLQRLRNKCTIPECEGSYKPSYTELGWWVCNVCGHRVENPGQSHYDKVSPVAGEDKFTKALRGFFSSGSRRFR